MFNAVTKSGGKQSDRISVGVVVSVLLHLALVAGIILATRTQPPKEKPTELTFYRPRPGPPRSAPASPAAARAPRTQATKTHARRPLLKPVTVAAAVQTRPVETDTDAAEETGSEPGGPPGGEAGGQPGGTGTGTGDQLFSLGTQGLTPPTLLQDSPIEYPREAREAQVQGIILVRCTIRTDGGTEDCRILKGLPMLNDAVLASLRARRYRPAQFEGRPAKVAMIITVRLQLRR